MEHPLGGTRTPLRSVPPDSGASVTVETPPSGRVRVLVEVGPVECLTQALVVAAIALDDAIADVFDELVQDDGRAAGGPSLDGAARYLDPPLDHAPTLH
jgi:hypothetical protein